MRTEYHKYCKAHKLKTSGDKSVKYVLETKFGAGEERRKIGETQVAIWSGIVFKPEKAENEAEKTQNEPQIVSQVRQVGEFDSEGNIEKRHMTEKTLATLPSLATPEKPENNPFAKFEKKPENNAKNEPFQFTPEEIAKSGLDPELIKETIQEIEKPEEPNEPEMTEKELFYKKMAEMDEL